MDVIFSLNFQSVLGLVKLEVSFVQFENFRCEREWQVVQSWYKGLGKNFSTPEPIRQFVGDIRSKKLWKIKATKSFKNYFLVYSLIYFAVVCWIPTFLKQTSQFFQIFDCYKKKEDDPDLDRYYTVKTLHVRTVYT